MISAMAMLLVILMIITAIAFSFDTWFAYYVRTICFLFTAQSLFSVFATVFVALLMVILHSVIGMLMVTFFFYHDSIVKTIIIAIYNIV